MSETNIRRVALLGNHLPRQCGIATFTTDLSEAIASVGPDLDCFVLAMNDGRNVPRRGASVRGGLPRGTATASYRAADSRTKRCRLVRHLAQLTMLFDPAPYPPDDRVTSA